MAFSPKQIAISGKTTPYEVLSQSLHFTNDNERQWWHGCAPLLSKQLLSSQYDMHVQYKFLIFLREHVIPAVGLIPRKVAGTDVLELPWKGVHLTGLTLEFSYNVSQSMVRMAVEPVGPFAGTLRDPFNTTAVWEFLRRLCNAPIGAGLDTQRFCQFAADVITSEFELNAAISAEADPNDLLRRVGPRRTQTLIGIDLQKSGKLVTKGYLYPQIKSQITGIPVNKLLFDAVRKSDPEGTLSVQLANLEHYLSTRQVTRSQLSEKPSGRLSLCMLGCDLVAPTVSRTKLYGMDEQVDWKTIEGIWTFNGLRQDPDTLDGLQILQQLWHLVPVHDGFCPMNHDFFTGIGAVASDVRCPMMVHYNLSPGQVFPEPQIYLPTFGVRDIEILDALTLFFESQGWTQMARYYKANFIATYPDEDFSEARHICYWISFAYKRGGAYMSLYNHSFEPVGEPLNG